MSPAPESPHPRLPSVDRVLRDPALADTLSRYGAAIAADAVRAALEALRQLGGGTPEDIRESAVATLAAKRAAAEMAPTLRPVFNLTGTVLHTNLGRAPLPPEAVEAMVAAAGAANLEFDLETGRRGDRDEHVEFWLRRLTGAEAATVVNNNAAAVLLMLNSLARGREVPVSRGELIEIGGAFRMPDIMSRAGCRLIEVGTTNRTHKRDFAAAIGPKTALLMSVHTSNYEIRGFTAAVPERELAELAHAHDLPFVVDLGSGQLTDLSRYGLPHEPTPAETIAAGADLVSFSGDKLLGGPQAGIIVGRRDLVERVKRNPMKRAMRLDKVTLAALAAVLRLYADPERLAERVPAIRMLARPEGDIRALAERLAPMVAAKLGGIAVAAEPCRSQIGSGALPLDQLPSWALAVRPGGRRPGATLNRIAAAFRALPVPVVGRIHDDAFLLDLRCLEDESGFLAQLDRLAVSA
ncbi:MAG: L-seryl-tRNA(Sec) selenium transferase [Alphaproteobacteria bacterium]